MMSMSAGGGERDADLPPPAFVRPPKFDFNNPEEAKKGCEYLLEHGYVVARGVLNEAEVTQAHSMFWDFMEGYPDRMDQKYPGFKGDLGSGIDRNDIMTWTDHNWPGAHQTGIINDYGANHSPFAWFVRSRPPVKKVFEHVWNTSDLLVSFDAINAFRPWEFDKEWKTKGGWFHVDQNPQLLKERVCIQGLVALTPVTEQSGGLCVVSGSHKEFQSLNERVKINWNHHFVALPNAEGLALNAKSCVILCDSGDMCLWDSRTIHCNCPGIEKKEELSFGSSSSSSSDGPSSSSSSSAIPESSSSSVSTDGSESVPVVPIDTRGMSWEDKQKIKRDAEMAKKRPFYLAKKAQKAKWDVLRLVAYVCMTPTSFADGEVIKQRQEAVKQCQGTSHWPHYFIASGREQPGFGNNPFIVKELVVGSGKNGSCNLM